MPADRPTRKDDHDHCLEQARRIRELIETTDPATDIGGTYAAGLRRDLALWEQLAGELARFLGHEQPVETAELF